MCLDSFGRVAPNDGYCTAPTTPVALEEPCNTSPCAGMRYEVLPALTPCSAQCMSVYPSTNVPTLSAGVRCVVNSVVSPLSACKAARMVPFASGGLGRGLSTSAHILLKNVGACRMVLRWPTMLSLSPCPPGLALPKA